jgi:hypothetical protein
MYLMVDKKGALFKGSQRKKYQHKKYTKNLIIA